jgi:Ca2+-binding EF-hand superfamily protein
MFRISLIVFGLLASNAAVAQAQETPQSSNRSDVQKQIDQNFSKGDVNNDGFLSRQEVQSMTVKASQQIVQRMEKEFATLDKDKNGQVSLAEFKAGAMTRLAANAATTMDKLDKNKDGKVSTAEFRLPILATFDRLDTNKDGKLSDAEKAKARRP